MELGFHSDSLLVLSKNPFPRLTLTFSPILFSFQTQIDQYIDLARTQVNTTMAK